ncbi:MAG: ribulose-phosphate 3-epimerase [Chlamydiia bacterium]|nr:ribulose-phosphate 3-epimerase [Chlamydiia bacterium]MCP5509057.1 ribulose-phosphate 3-epimerase [Chlamydiales bacterium]HPE85330.1 ribulose-phosphate 3-epimerase [Chlamydiales bacterium]
MKKFKGNIKIEPSIFAADFTKLGDEAKRCEDAGADAIHFDIMDGHFVRNLSLSPKALSAINRSTDLFLDVHIMVYSPFDYIEKLVECGADQITFHFEATEDVAETLEFIRRCNIKAGLAFCPETSYSLIPKYLDKIDTLLLMTVNPGWGGQAFIMDVLDKVRFARKTIDDLDLKAIDIQVDGGIDAKTAKLCIDAGANNLVAGTYLFEGDMKAKIMELRQ